MKYSLKNEYIYVEDIGFFDLEKTLESGQCFRWKKADNGYLGTAFGKTLYVEQEGETLKLFCSLEDFESVWKDYFALDEDYDSIDAEILACEPILKQAAEASRGIRVLRQESWEALCSFVISQNSNIPKIKLSVSRLCESFGEQLESGEYSFPSAEVIAKLSPEELAPLRCGYRAPYIIDCAKKAASGELDFEAVKTAPIDEAREILLTVKGIGKKVADCSLLYGFGRMDCFPVDRWMVRAMEKYFPNGSPITTHRYAGIAQLYIFSLMIHSDEKE